MNNRNSTDILDSVATVSLLTTASAASRTEPDDEFTSIQDNFNVVNSRYMFYTSKKISSSLSFKAKDDYKTAAAKELDSYMNSILDRSIRQKFVNCAINSGALSADLSNSSFINRNVKSKSSFNLKKNDLVADLIKQNLLLYEKNLREDHIFSESLEESDKWHELEEEFRKKTNEAMINFGDSPQNDSKLNQAIKKDNIRIQKLEEINKALLMGVNVNYLEDEESKRIMFKEQT